MMALAAGVPFVPELIKVGGSQALETRDICCRCPEEPSTNLHGQKKRTLSRADRCAYLTGAHLTGCVIL